MKGDINLEIKMLKKLKNDDISNLLEMFQVDVKSLIFSFEWRKEAIHTLVTGVEREKLLSELKRYRL